MVTWQPAVYIKRLLPKRVSCQVLKESNYLRLHLDLRPCCLFHCVAVNVSWALNLICCVYILGMIHACINKHWFSQILTLLHHQVFARELSESQLTKNWFALITNNIQLASSLCVWERWSLQTTQLQLTQSYISEGNPIWPCSYSI